MWALKWLSGTVAHLPLTNAALFKKSRGISPVLVFHIRCTKTQIPAEKSHSMEILLSMPLILLPCLYCLMH